MMTISRIRRTASLKGRNTKVACGVSPDVNTPISLMSIGSGV